MIFGYKEKNRYTYDIRISNRKFTLYINVLTNRNTFFTTQAMDDFLSSYGDSVKHRQYFLV